MTRPTTRQVPTIARRSEDRWLLAGYAGLAGFFALEALLRHRQRLSLTASDDDRGTTRTIIAAYAVAADLPVVVHGATRRRLPAAAGGLGLALEATGLGLRAWSMRVLGGSYSRTLRSDGAVQPLVDRGPYRAVRHPGYAGSLLTWTGFALTSRSIPVVIAVPGLLGAAYVRRIAAEEQLLHRELPGYYAYAARSKRLLPFVW